MAETMLKDGLEQERQCFARLEILKLLCKSIQGMPPNYTIGGLLKLNEQLYSRYLEQLQKRRCAIEEEVNEMWG